MKKVTLAILGLSMIAGQAFAQDVPKDAPPGEAPVASGVPGTGGHGHHMGNITKQQYLDFQGKRFDAMDTNHDGVLSPDERKVAFEQMKAKHQQWKAQHSNGAPASGDNQ